MSGNMSTTIGVGADGVWTTSPVVPVPAGISAASSTSDSSDDGISVDGS